MESTLRLVALVQSIFWLHLWWEMRVTAKLNHLQCVKYALLVRVISLLQLNYMYLVTNIGHFQPNEKTTFRSSDPMSRPVGWPQAIPTWRLHVFILSNQASHMYKLFCNYINSLNPMGNYLGCNLIRGMSIIQYWEVYTWYQPPQLIYNWQTH